MDSESNGEVQELINRIELVKEKLEKSSFYEEFTKQMEQREMVERIENVIGCIDGRYSQLQLVLYGLGGLHCSGEREIEIREYRHMQFALAILLREKFQWVSDIQVYDPVFSAIDRMAINVFNCTCLSYDEKCIRIVEKPTRFFMPR